VRGALAAPRHSRPPRSALSRLGAFRSRKYRYMTKHRRHRWTKPILYMYSTRAPLAFRRAGGRVKRVCR
jgi:hypothetical protein